TTRPGVPLPQPVQEPTVQGDPAASIETRWRVVATARRLLGQTNVRWPGQSFPDDCSGLVLGVYASVGVPLTGSARPGDNGVTAVWRWTSARGRLFRTGRPDPGDLVFFHDTYDRDHDGKLDDGLTHIALVESVDSEGTVSIIHRVSRGVMRYRMNLDRPALRTEPGTGRAGPCAPRPPRAASQPLAGANLRAGPSRSSPDSSLPSTEPCSRRRRTASARRFRSSPRSPRAGISESGPPQPSSTANQARA